MVEAETCRTVGTDLFEPRFTIQFSVLDALLWGGEGVASLGHRGHIIGIGRTT